MSTIKDKNLATIGQQEVDWAARQMKVLEEIKTEFSSSKPLNGLNIGACMHVTKETANLMLTLRLQEQTLPYVHRIHYRLRIRLRLIYLKMILKYTQYMVYQMRIFLNILILYLILNRI